MTAAVYVVPPDWQPYSAPLVQPSSIAGQSQAAAVEKVIASTPKFEPAIALQTGYDYAEVGEVCGVLWPRETKKIILFFYNRL